MFIDILSGLSVIKYISCNGYFLLILFKVSIIFSSDIGD